MVYLNFQWVGLLMRCPNPGLDDRPGQGKMSEVVFVLKANIHGKLCLITRVSYEHSEVSKVAECVIRITRRARSGGPRWLSSPELAIVKTDSLYVFSPQNEAPQGPVDTEMNFPWGICQQDLAHGFFPVSWRWICGILAGGTHLTFCNSALADCLWGFFISLDYGIVSQWHGLKHKCRKLTFLDVGSWDGDSGRFLFPLWSVGQILDGPACELMIPL